MAKLIKVKELNDKFKKIVDDIINLQSKDEIKTWFHEFAMSMSFMKSYSFRNLLLIHSQKSNAIFTNGFVSWKKLGRYPKKGTGIYIYKPIFKKVDNIESDKSESDDDNEPKKVLIGFSPICVFDYQDTKGKPIDIYEKILSERNKIKIQCYGTHGDVSILVNLSKKFDQYINQHGFKYEITDTGDAAGFAIHSYEYNKKSGTVVKNEFAIDDNFNIKKGQEFGTKLHEFYHVKYHKLRSDKQRCELEAEMYSALVLGAFNLNIDKCAAYLYNWTQKLQYEKKKEIFLDVFDNVYKEAHDTISFIRDEEEKPYQNDEKINIPF